MRLALLSPVHGQSIDHIARQLENYRTFLDPFELRHYLHISLESSPVLGDQLLAFAEREQHSIVLTQRSRPTWRPCTAHALSELIKTVLADAATSDAVLIHTDTDLLFSEAAAQQIKRHRIGCGDKPFRGRDGRWKWTAKANADPRIQTLVRELLDGDASALRIGRVCGAFMPWTVFKTFGVIYNHYFDNTYLEEHPRRHWPVTEIAIPTILRYLEGPNSPFQPPLIKAPKNKQVSRALIKRSLRREDCFGLKKLSRASNLKALQYLETLQQNAKAAR